MLETASRPSGVRTAAPIPAGTISAGGVTSRVVALCLGLAVVFGYAIPIIDYKLGNTFLGATYLPPGAIGALLVLLLVVNPLLKLISKAWSFTRNEVLTVYISCLFSCLAPGHGGEGFVLFNLIAPFYMANRTNRWLDWLVLHLKPWLTPALTHGGQFNRAVVENWFMGTGHAPIPWGAWALPLVFWASFVLVSYFMLACLGVILRRQWAENEALTFPLLRLPLELTEGMDASGSALPPLFHNPLMWIGFGIAVFVRLANGLHLYFPDVPEIPLSIPATQYLSEAPWNQIGFVKVTIIPLAVGIGFLLTTEMSLSLWLFMWLFKFQYLAAYFLGYPPAGLPEAGGILDSKLFIGYQMVGCNLAYVAIVMWMGREHLLHVARRALGQARPLPGEANEVLSYPVAFWGFLLSFAAMVAATCAAGVRIDIAVLLWVSYLVIAIALTRLTAEGGLVFLLFQTSALGAIAGLFNSGASSWMTLENGVVPASVFQNGMTYHMRGFLMPSFLQSFKLAYDQGINGRRLGLLIAAVILVSMAMGWSMLIRLGYETGGNSLRESVFIQGVAPNSMNFVQRMMRGDASASVAQNWFWLAVGFAVTIGLVMARGRYSWFCLHPLGYLVGMTYPVQVFWLSLFIAWAAKVTINRYGGVEAVRKVTPMFLGLALGDVTMMLFWLVADGFAGRVGHSLSNG